MIISDLNHVEVVSEETETSIEGGFLWSFSPYTFSTSHVFTAPLAGAQGWTTSASTFTSTITPPGYRGSSSASSSSTVCYW